YVLFLQRLRVPTSTLFPYTTLFRSFRCRLVTAAGEIVEGTYAAESESRLRHELENQGLHVLALRKRSLLGGIEGLPQRRRIPKRSEEHTSELQSRSDLVCRLLLEKK